MQRLPFSDSKKWEMNFCFFCLLSASRGWLSSLGCAGCFIHMQVSQVLVCFWLSVFKSSWNHLLEVWNCPSCLVLPVLEPAAQRRSTPSLPPSSGHHLAGCHAAAVPSNCCSGEVEGKYSVFVEPSLGAAGRHHLQAVNGFPKETMCAGSCCSLFV